MGFPIGHERKSIITQAFFPSRAIERWTGRCPFDSFGRSYAVQDEATCRGSVVLCREAVQSTCTMVDKQ